MRPPLARVSARLWWVWASLACVAVVACGRGQKPGAVTGGTLPGADVAGAGPVVAVVEGPLGRFEINGAAVARLARERGVSAQAALTEAVEFELLAREARRRGLASDAEVTEEGRRVAAQRFIEVDFEPTLQAVRVPDEMLREAYDANAGRFNHRELRQVTHALAQVPEGASAASRAEQHQLAERIAAAVRGAASEAEFLERVERLRPSGAGQDVFRSEQLPEMPHARLEKGFADVAWALPRPGAISGVAESSYGFHVIYLVKIIPATHKTFEDARAELRQELFERWKSEEFKRFADALLARHVVVRNDAALAKLPER